MLKSRSTDRLRPHKDIQQMLLLLGLMWTLPLCQALSLFGSSRSRIRQFSSPSGWKQKSTNQLLTSLAVSSPPSTGSSRLLDPVQVAKEARKECTHIIVCPGFATCTEDYTSAGSLVPNLAARGGWEANQIHVLDIDRKDWLLPTTLGLQDPSFVAALAGIPGKYCPPDRPPYRWYLKKVANKVKKIDEQVKKEYGSDSKAKIILLGHSAGGWLARAAVGYGTQEVDGKPPRDDIAMDVDNLLGINTLGTPNKPPPPGRPDVTGGALRVVNEQFPGSFLEDKLFYITIGGTSDTTNTTDGIVSLEETHLDGADQMTLTRQVAHAAQLVGKTAQAVTVWYGSDDVVTEWFGEVNKHLEYMQGSGKASKGAATPTNGDSASSENLQVAEAALEQYLRRKNALRTSDFFKDIVDRDTLERMIFSMEEISVPRGEKLFTQGDEADAIYFIRSGEFECYEEKTKEVKATLGKKDVVGESGVLMGEPRYLSVRASSDEATLFRLPSEEVHRLVSQRQQRQSAALLAQKVKYEGYFEEKSRSDLLLQCSLFDDLGYEDIKALGNSVTERNVTEGERIIAEGDIADSMYIIADGEFACYRESTLNVVATLGKGDYFGELGILFDQPRQVSVKATRNSTVWELDGKTFKYLYRKAAISRLGEASWMLLLLQKIPRPRFLKKAFRNASGFRKKIQLLDRHFQRGDIASVSKAVTANMLMTAILPFAVWVARKSCVSILSDAIISIGFVSLLYDNFINGYGRYFGEGNRLRQLTKLRCILHGVAMPLFFVPMFEVLKRAKVMPPHVAKISSAFALAFALHEFGDWIRYDTSQLRLVDHRDSTVHKGQSLAGSMRYTSGKIFKLVLPAVCVNLSSIIFGAILLRRGALAPGWWMLGSSLFTFLTSAIQLPTAQLLGETALLGGIYMSLISS